MDSSALGWGERLPASRVLAEQLGVSRGVVTEAYARLAEQGLVETDGRRGTRVRAGAPDRDAVLRPPIAGVQEPMTSPLTTPLGNEGFDRLREAPARVDLTPGRPDLSAFPRNAWLRAERDVLRQASAADLGYGDPRGTRALRSALSRWLARTRGVQVDPSAVLVVAGVAQGLSLLAQVLARQGDSRIAVEDPGSIGVRLQLQAWGMTPVPIPVDDHGLDVTALEGSGCGTVIVTPAHQFPTGVVLSGQRRTNLLAWAQQFVGLVVEDDYDAEHRYDRHPVPALASRMPANTYYCSSVSKTLAPALRIGWVVPPPKLLAAIVDAKRDTDLGNATLPQLVLAELLARGDVERHMRATRRRHLARRDALLAGLRTLGGRAEILGAAAGLHLTVRLPDVVDDVELATVLLVDHEIKTQPLSWHRQRPGPPGLVLGYAATTPDTLYDAGERIAAAVSTSRW